MNDIKRNLLMTSTVLALAMLTTQGVNADQDNVDKSWYIGGSLGRSFLQPNENNTNWEVTREKDVSQRVYIGKSINNSIGLEAFWTDLGEATVRSTTGGGDGAIAYQGYGVSAVYKLPYGIQYLEPYIKVGVARFKTSDKKDALSRQHNDTSAFGGIGLNYPLTDQISLRTELDVYDKDVQDLNVGFKWRPSYKAHSHTKVKKVQSEPVVVVQPKPKIVYREVKPKIVYVPQKVIVKQPAPKPKYKVINRNLVGGSNFAPNSSALSGVGQHSLNQLIADINNQKVDVKSIVVTGHTDSDGKAQANYFLSVNRAKAIANYLSSKGLNRSLIQTIGKGESQPIADNRSNSGKERNRRVEIYIKGLSWKQI